MTPQGSGLQLRDRYLFTRDYDRTLMAWASNINEQWDRLADRYDERFRRRWEFYLHGCAAAFRAGLIHVSQIAYTKA